MLSKKYSSLAFILTALFILKGNTVLASTSSLNLQLGANNAENLNIMVYLTALSLSPAIILCCTCFPRYVFTLSFLRQALGVQQTPSNQIIIGLSLFMTIFTMQPTFTKIYDSAYKPYIEKKINSTSMMDITAGELKKFMLKQTREKDLLLFAEHSGLESLPNTREGLSIFIIIPAFIVGEITRSFIFGCMLYIAFVTIDMIVAFILMAMGMMMLPPMAISLPIKLLIFLASDGWNLIINSLIKSFQ